MQNYKIIHMALCRKRLITSNPNSAISEDLWTICKNTGKHLTRNLHKNVSISQVSLYFLSLFC